MNKSLRPLLKNDNFQYLACDWISQISLIHHKFVFFIVFRFMLILLFTFPGSFFAIDRFFVVAKMGKKVCKRDSEAQIVTLNGQNLSEWQISAQMGCRKTK